MGVYIEGMKIPDKITQVIFYPDGNVYVFRDVIDNDLKLTAIEIPTPHGRLIEVPKSFDLSGLVYIPHNDFMRTAQYFIDQVARQPTVIAEEGSEC